MNLALHVQSENLLMKLVEHHVRRAHPFLPRPIIRLNGQTTAYAWLGTQDELLTLHHACRASREVISLQQAPLVVSSAELASTPMCQVVSRNLSAILAWILSHGARRGAPRSTTAFVMLDIICQREPFFAHLVKRASTNRLMETIPRALRVRAIQQHWISSRQH